MKPWPGISRGTECTVPIIPGLVIDAVVPAKSSGEILFATHLDDEVFVRVQEAGEVEGLGALHVGHEQRVRAVALLHVDREAEVHVLVAHDDGLAVLGGVRGVEGREVGERAQHRVRDEVREAHLARAGAREVVVEDLAVDLEQLRGDRRAPRWRWGPRGSPPCSRPCGRRRRAAARAPRPRAPAGPGRGAGGAGACGRCRSGGRRRGGRGGCSGSGGRRRRRLGSAAVGGRGLAVEVVTPVAVDRGRVLEVALVQLLGQTRVGTEIVEAAHGTSFTGRSASIGCIAPTCGRGSRTPTCSRRGGASDQRRRSSATWNARSSDWRALSRGSQLVS